MQEADYQLLVERLAQCEELAAHARDPVVREKAAELVSGYRDLIASVDRLALNKWAIIKANTISSQAVMASRGPPTPLR